MNGLHHFTAELFSLAALIWRQFLHAPLSWKLAGLVGVGFLVALFTVRSSEHNPIVRLNGLSWSRDDFCRGWLITGDTGSGKTRSGINQLLFQVFQNEPRWGGLCIDDKGIYWETLAAMARHFNRERDLVLLQVRPDNARSDWKPNQTYNLTSAPGIPFSTFAKFVVDSASSLGQQNDKGFFKSQVQTHLTLALELIYEIEGDVTLENALNVLLDHKDMEEAMKTLSESHQTQRRMELRDHFIKRYLNQPPEQMGGVRETIGNYLQCFSTPDIAEVFCAVGKSNTFEFSDIDHGKIICVSMPQKYQMERRYVNTFLKMLFYTHVLRRFDKTKAERVDDNLLILWADEAQRFVTAAEDGMAASGEIPARILQTRAAKFVREGESRVTEIDFTNAQFPQIKPFGALPDEDETTDFQSLCVQMNIIGDHDLFLRELKKAFTLAEYDSPILLLGETGAGKEVFARLIHRASKRAAKPFITANCAAFAETLIESQLFGHRKGAFTGADRDHAGCFEEADGGTLFLDELGEMPTQCQAKLLRAIQNGKIQRLGDSKESTVNIRVIAATNVDIKRAVEEKALRKDLYYRFEATISIPSLRDRRNDIPKLSHHFLEVWNQKHQKQRRLSQQAIIALMKHPWPGNVRELQGVVVRSAQLCSGKIIEPENLLFDEVLTTSGLDALPEPQDGFVLNDFLSSVRGLLIEKAMKRSDANRTKAASLLGITPQAVSQYLRSRQ